MKIEFCCQGLAIESKGMNWDIQVRDGDVFLVCYTDNWDEKANICRYCGAPIEITVKGEGE
jgi:hypothetical protein